MRHVFGHVAAATRLTRRRRGPQPRPSCSSTITTDSTRFYHPEPVRVQSGPNGNVHLDIHYPVAATACSPSTVLIHLPSGLDDDPSTQHRPTALSRLASSLACPVVDIKYRTPLTSGPTAAYPSPVHDVLAGYDWVRSNLLPPGPDTGHRQGPPARILVVGELLGGSLATQLALTECRVGQPGVVAAAVHNPLADWVDLGLQTPQHYPPDDAIHDRILDLMAHDRHEEAMVLWRHSLFSKPEHWFDPFASPILFFRSAGVHVPSPPPPPPTDMDLLSLLDRQEHDGHGFGPTLSRSADEAWPQPDSDDPDPIHREKVEPARRKASRGFPSKKLGLKLPCFRISASNVSPYVQQAEELANQIRRSVIRQRTQAVSNRGRKVLLPDEYDRTADEDERAEIEALIFEAERKVRFHVEVPGSTDGRIFEPLDFENIAPWMHDALALD